MKRIIFLILTSMLLFSATAFAESGIIIYFDGRLMIIETETSGYSCGWEYWFPFEQKGQDGREADDVEKDKISGDLTTTGQHSVYDWDKEIHYDIYIDESGLTKTEAQDWLTEQKGK